ncbi:hypothetical protein HK105_204800 [Polyrhizophydium stewartii]|uniref:Uncharacterized protein n=1 Tax=Polyrhizophydium stewartii TaxID=2732419 RepID=A0ABR4N7Y0_9FUNG
MPQEMAGDSDKSGIDGGKPATPKWPWWRQPEPSSDDTCPKTTASVVSKLLFLWMDPVFRLGWRRPLELKDIWKLPLNMRVEVVADELERAWAAEVAAHPPKNDAKAAAGDSGGAATPQAHAKAADDSPSLRRALWSWLFRKLLPIGFLKFACDACSMAAPVIVKLVISYVASAHTGSSSAPLGVGFGLAVLLFVLQFASALFLNAYFMTAFESAVAVRSALTGTIYRKSMRLSPAARQNFSSGKITNLVSTDTQRFEFLILYLNLIWTSPVQIVIIVALLISQLGWPALVGAVITIAMGPVQKVLFRVLSKIREEVAPTTDMRVRLTQEGLQGIRVLKFFTWEKPFLQKIEDLRKKEVRLNLKRSIAIAFVSTMAFSLPSIAAAISFIIYSLTAEGGFDPARIFASLAWFNQLPMPLAFLPQVFSSYADVSIAIKRIQELLLAPEVEAPATIATNAPNAVEIVDGEFNWDSMPPSDDSANAADGTAKAKAARPPRWFVIKPKGDKDGGEELEPVSDSSTVTLQTAAPPAKSTLRNINIAVPRGKLVAVVGSVGSGKSSLLNALVGEMKRVKGTVTFSSRLGYAPQQAWIQNASVKDNILFGQPFDEERYHAAIRDCSLEKDLEILADGDLTQIGERGINLSGGQKQRVNLARMVYFNADIVLLDDPLSAVDAHVGRALFDNCIQGALAGKTRILVTHQLHFLPRVDYVIVMSDGEVSEQGTFSELMAADGEFATLMRNYGGVEDTESDDATSSEGGDAIEKTAVGAGSRGGNAKGVIADADKKDVRELMQTEERATGKVDGKVWLSYFKAAGGGGFAVGLILILLFMQGSQSASSIWLAVWSESSVPNFSANQYIGVFMGISVASAIAYFLYGTYLAVQGTRAGRVLHEAALSNVFRAPVGFFDTTPLGRIINRFSKDQDGIDTALIEAFRMFLETLSLSLASFALIIYATPMFVIPFVPVLVIYYLVQMVYRRSSRELKRLDSITRSPLFAHIGETLNGTATVRAYREQDRFIVRNNELINTNFSPYFIVFGSSRWLSVRFEFLGSLLVFFTAMFGVLSRNNPSFSPAFFGLAISYSLQISGYLNWCIRQFTDMEIAMNAVERVEFYAHRLELEAPEITDVRPPASWPAKGEIEFKDVSMRYAADLPLVLKSVSFSIRDKEKIGVVGRTGSGKSSLMQVLFRMVEPASGAIVVDGITTSELGLKDLRSGLGIIPQDPVLFSGTFRRNLDPFGEHTCAELWDALERANIKAKVAESDGGLDGEVHENGENLSVGQRQLVCLARAMLKKPRVLVMDEATANVDYETDAIIQKCLRQDFGDSTVLTIAHRLNTIVDYDRVMVLSAGEIVEFDTPQALVAKEGGVFRSMVDETGPQNVEVIMRILNADARDA